VTAKRVAIVQSNYVPWRGYFDLIGSVDEFVLLDDVQYTRRDWRNRNRIKTAQGTRWLSVPLNVKGNYTAPICEMEVADPGWAEAHWDTVRQAYAKAPGFDANGALVREAYETIGSPRLSAINEHLLEWFARRLGIETPLRCSVDLDPQGSKTDRLVDLCKKVGATEYVSGPGARAYLEEERFAERGIAVSWFEYGPYPEYEQVHPPFDPQVSILDVLLCGGEDAARLVAPDRAEARR
jgi:hypothetical protein